MFDEWMSYLMVLAEKDIVFRMFESFAFRSDQLKRQQLFV